jgi:hypothetical protein
MAATACAPPAQKTCLTPHSRAAASTSSAMCPSCPGGEHMTTSSQPASVAGMASIKTVDTRGALPPGMYSPTGLNGW